MKEVDENAALLAAQLCTEKEACRLGREAGRQEALRELCVRLHLDPCESMEEVVAALGTREEGREMAAEEVREGASHCEALIKRLYRARNGTNPSEFVEAIHGIIEEGRKLFLREQKSAEERNYHGN